MLTVPKMYPQQSGRQLQYFKRMGYRQVEAAGNTASSSPTQQQLEFESTDQYAGRLQGYMLFFGAFVQSERPGQPYGLAQGWQYTAR